MLSFCWLDRRGRLGWKERLGISKIPELSYFQKLLKVNICIPTQQWLVYPVVIKTLQGNPEPERISNFMVHVRILLFSLPFLSCVRNRKTTTPPKINIELENDGLVQMIFLNSKGAQYSKVKHVPIFRGLVFRGFSKTAVASCAW